MSFPLFPEKVGRPGLLSPERMIAFRRSHGGLRGVEPATDVIVCLYRGLMRRIAWRHPFRHVRGFAGDMYVIRQAPRRVAVIGNVGIGGPAIVNLEEELIAWGARRVVVLSLAGGIAPGLATGSVVVCDRAIRDEGTSYHYLPPARDVRASDALASLLSRGLAARGITSARGPAWSTDAPYRETREETEALREEGVLAVDMESAGVFAAARVREAEAASVLVIGDTLRSSGWSPPSDMAGLHRRLRSVLDAIVSSLGTSE